MKKRQSRSIFSGLLWVAGKLPWWISLAVAGGCWYGLNRYAAVAPSATGIRSLTELGRATSASLLWVGAYVGQYLLPAIFVLGALGSAFSGWRERSLYRRVLRNPQAMAEGMDWHDFEILIAEVFRRRGYKAELTQAGPDGGVDVVLRKGGARYLVQCKQWAAARVGVGVVRELFGVMAAEGVEEGFVVTSGTFTHDAHEFAEGKPIHLVDYFTLCEWLGVEHGRLPAPKKVVRRVPSCPECQALMVPRVAARGPGSGETFWGCSHYPSCRGMRKAA